MEEAHKLLHQYTQHSYIPTQLHSYAWHLYLNLTSVQFAYEAFIGPGHAELH